MKENFQITAKLLAKSLNQEIPLSLLISDLSLKGNARLNLGQIKALLYEVTRWYYQLHFFAQTLLEKPLKNKDKDVYALILIGLYQLRYTQIAEHAVISELVEATVLLKKPWAKKLVNAILRKFQREQDNLIQQLAHNLSAKWAFPNWIIKKISEAWPSYVDNILNESNTHPPLSIRLNTARLPKEDFLKAIDNLHKTATVLPFVPCGYTLSTDIKTSEIPGFLEGAVSVQDGAAQLAPLFLDPQPQDNILDACAAPGGKTGHLLEYQPALHSLTALDIVAARVGKIRENLNRLKLHAKIQIANALTPDTWWDGQLFDKILLDAPCSASGVIRRNPDIKLHRKKQDLQSLAETQLNLLKALWPLLKPNGILLYITCSILPEENAQLIKTFMDQVPNVQVLSLPQAADIGLPQLYGLQILPGMNRMDGFYFCKLQKTATL